VCYYGWLLLAMRDDTMTFDATFGVVLEQTESEMGADDSRLPGPFGDAMTGVFSFHVGI
jgi:hypothetical protein